MRWFGKISLSVFLALIGTSYYAVAGGFPFNNNVTLSVGQSIILKGVRASSCDSNRAPSWSHVKAKLPRSKTGTFSNGGAGTVESDSCGKEVPARGVRFTAKKAGSESFRVFKDRIKITVK